MLFGNLRLLSEYGASNVWPQLHGRQLGARTADNRMLTNPTDNELGRRRTNNSDMEAGFEVHFEIPLHAVYSQGFLACDRDGKAFSSLAAYESEKRNRAGKGRTPTGLHIL
jgi:hypothetical protein